MNNKHNIDKLLKESFENFSPEAPDVWQAVQQGVQAANAAASSASTVTAVKSVGLTMKVVAGIVLGAAAVTGYVFYAADKDPVLKSQSDKIETVQPIAEKEVTLNEIPDGTSVQEAASAKKSNYSGKQDHPEMKEEKSIRGVETGSYDDPLPETPAKPLVKETRNETSQMETGTVKENVVPGTIRTDMNQKETRQPVIEPPYNPYAEDGEVDEKPLVPGSFSPNNDGLNDRFEVIIENESLYSLMILNEKGELVFESKNKQQVWDGKHYKTGVPCPVGKYLYVLNYQFKGSDKIHEKSGIIGLFF